MNLLAVDVVEIATHDPELARETLSRLYHPDSQLDTHVSSRRIDFMLHAVQAGDLHTGRFRHTHATHSDAPPVDEFLVASVLGGELKMAAGHDHRTLRRGDVIRHLTTARTAGTWSVLDVAMLRVPMAAVQRVAGERNGLAAAALRFDGMAPMSAKRTGQWHALAGFVHRSINTPNTVLDSPLVRQHLIDLIAATALAVFPNTTMTTDPRPGPGRTAPAVVRRAVAYIDAHAAESISMTDIATAAGVSARALQAAFRSHLGTTPGGYLRRVRLDAAHRDLRAADPHDGTTVAAIAARWGFGHAARFTASYREQFGVLPSHTLRR